MCPVPGFSENMPCDPCLNIEYYLPPGILHLLLSLSARPFVELVDESLLRVLVDRCRPNENADPRLCGTILEGLSVRLEELLCVLEEETMGAWTTGAGVAAAGRTTPRRELSPRERDAKGVCASSSTLAVQNVKAECNASRAYSPTITRSGRRVERTPKTTSVPGGEPPSTVCCEGVSANWRARWQSALARVAQTPKQE